jgi:hypothetical protein
VYRTFTSTVPIPWCSVVLKIRNYLYAVNCSLADPKQLLWNRIRRFQKSSWSGLYPTKI